MKYLSVCALVSLLPLTASAQGPSFAPQQAITTQAAGVWDAIAADLDGDGDLDVLSASFDSGEIAWSENLGAGVFGSLQVITTLAKAARTVFATDLDGDGDVDVLSASLGNGYVAWYENLGGGVFGPQQVIASSVDSFALSVNATDLDGDGAADVLASTEADGVGWYKNLGGGTFGPLRKITGPGSHGVTGAHAADLDGDGDADVISTFSHSHLAKDTTVWWENLGGGLFGPKQVLATSTDGGVWSDYATDLDGDGDVDVLTTSYWADKVSWYENLGGGTFGPERVITTSAIGAISTYAIDLDGDGDVDVISSGIKNGSRIAWHENLGGGVFGPHEWPPFSGSFAYSVHAADLDGDGDADILFPSHIQDKVAWFENLTGPYDCNGNGVADFTDIATGTSQDCNGNGTPDECDLASGYSIDIDGDGQLDVCFAPPLTADLYELSVAVGGTQTFAMTASVPLGLYLLLGTTSGTAPGTSSGGFIVPLNMDAYLLHTALSPNVAPLSSSFGVLTPDGTTGTATASFYLPPAFSPAIVGLTLHHAYVTLDQQTGYITAVSNAVPLALLP